jgi:hypothetical protein
MVIWASPQLLNVSEALNFEIFEKFIRGVRSGVNLCSWRYRLGDGRASSVSILELVG